MVQPTRRDLLTRGIRLTAAGAAGLTLCDPSAALATTTASVPPETASGRLVRLLRVELLLGFACRHVLAASIEHPRGERLLGTLLAHAQAHVQALELQLTARGGATPPAPASIGAADRDLEHRNVSERLGQLRGAGDGLRLVLAVQRVTVGAYFVALTKLQDPGLIRLAAEIMANGAQHEAMLAVLLDHGDLQQAVPYGLVQGVQ